MTASAKSSQRWPIPPFPNNLRVSALPPGDAGAVRLAVAEGRLGATTWVSELWVVRSDLERLLGDVAACEDDVFYMPEAVHREICERWAEKRQSLPTDETSSESDTYEGPNSIFTSLQADER